MLPRVALTLAGYLIGSISFGLLTARRHGQDLRGQGSGNTGATNVGRVLGRRLGRRVLVLDAAKGALPTLVAVFSFGPSDPVAALTGLATIVGHCFPLWHGFRGGKGAATAAGVMLALYPPAGLGALLVYLLAKRLTGRASVGSLLGALTGALVTAAALGADPRSILGGVAFGLITLRHGDNIRRLFRGQEPEQ